MLEEKLEGDVAIIPAPNFVAGVLIGVVNQGVAAVAIACLGWAIVWGFLQAAFGFPLLPKAKSDGQTVPGFKKWQIEAGSAAFAAAVGAAIAYGVKVLFFV